MNSTPQALKAARAYLKAIDGDDFGDPDDGHSVDECAAIIDRHAVQPLVKALRQAQEALKPFAHYQRQFDRKPMRGIGDDIHGIHSGTEFEANLCFSHMRAAVKALEELNKVCPE